jgi:alcohol dehydrogenase (cytochrome c)
VQGATNWYSQSWNPQLSLLYLITFEQCDIFTSSSKEPEPMKSFSGGGAGPKPNDKGAFYLRAINPLTGERKWEYKMTGKGDMWAGLTGTVTGVIFSGDDDGHVIALEAKTGRHLWHYQTGESIYASPITYMVDGKQYVTIASATAIHTFGLFEPVQSVPVPPRKIQ